MREIKFRGWTGKEMRLGWGCLTNESSKSFIVIDENDHYPEAVTLMQFTGLRDKNGTDIYEGDIVQNGLNEISKIVWDADTVAFIFLTKNAGIKNWINVKTDLDRNVEVIGNVYENPELCATKS
jgi:uncharacterized phage protein (TIGR01671 family)